MFALYGGSGGCTGVGCLVYCTMQYGCRVLHVLWMRGVGGFACCVVGWFASCFIIKVVLQTANSRYTGSVAMRVTQHRGCIVTPTEPFLYSSTQLCTAISAR